jgi:hypothetical protein
MEPVLGREVVERGEVVPVAVEGLGRRVLAVLVEPDGELVATVLTAGSGRCLPDLSQALAGVRPQALEQLVQDVASPVIPAALVAGLGEDLREGCPQPEAAVADREQRCHQAALGMIT